MAFAQHIAASNTDQLFKVLATDHTGERAFYFILVDKPKIPAFKKLKPEDHFNLKDYGTIITSGYGSEPPEHIMRRIKEDFNIED